MRATVVGWVLLVLALGAAGVGPRVGAAAWAAEDPWWHDSWTVRHRLEVPAQRGPDVDAAVGAITTHASLRPDGDDLRVVTASGRECARRILGVGPGDRVRFLFALREGESRYYAYLGNRAAPPSGLPYEARAGLVVEVRDLPEGRFVHAPEIVALFDSSTVVQGTLLVPQVFHGSNPAGPAERFVARYRGYLSVPAPGAYRVVTASSDASAVFVDGKVVAQWGGIHPANPGVTGRFGSTVDIAPGLHLLEYYWVKAADQAPPVAVLGLQAPTDPGPRLVPPAAFLQPLEAQVALAERRDGTPLADFDWHAVDHVEHGGLYAVAVQFTRAAGLAGEDAAFRWTFDDGSTASGTTVRKVFFGTGPRPVRLAWDGPGGTVETTLTVGVEPVWTRFLPPQGEAFEAYRKAFDLPDPRVADSRTLLAMVALADDLDRTTRLADLWDALRARADARSLPGFSRVAELLGERFLRPPFLSLPRAEEALRLGMAAAEGEEARLRCQRVLADLLVNAKGDPDGAEAFLDRLDRLRADPVQERLLWILEGDIEAERGDPAAAAACYDRAGATSRPWDKQVALRRQALLFAAEDWVRRGQHADAVTGLEDWLLEQPADRIDPRVLWLLGRASAGLDHLAKAAVLFERALRLDPAGPVAPPLLLALADLRRKMGDLEGATAREDLLLERFPYSDEAARLHARRKGIELGVDGG